ncbi:transglutaminase-like domain-containing protein [Cellvibrio mixtus]|uniref:transglutaminase-like domain-containing protein n=1 Tax=Cellvibrio mixtus TaxID=39650 RepID=UPI000A0595D6|nr:transglutaminase domain-containing protein [Cellvibrio mixtus]
MKQGHPINSGTNSITMDSFRGGLFARAIAALTLFFFTFVFYANPAAAAVANEINKEDQREAALEAAIETTPEKKLSNRLAKLRDKIVLELPQAIEQREADQNWFQSAFASVFGDGPITSEELAELQTLSTSIDTAYQEAITAFETEATQFEQEAAAVGNALSDDVKKLIKERHTQALDHIKSRYAQTRQQLAALVTAQSASAQEQALEQLNETLEQEQFKPTHTPATPESLPWKAPDETVREPVDNPQDLQATLGLNPYAKYAQLAQAGDTDPTLVAQAMANAANAELQAALTENIEIQLTPEIKTLAAQLHNSSIEIYTWVHNNIRFIPSYGSIQGAQHTLETKQGNAIDTASLLIALLRAAEIPARYAYGTVEIPATKVMNWVGDAKTPEAAQAILGMGGVPTIGRVEGGKITTFKLEHVWVEAYVDYFPSRGMKELAGDSWIPMDASFKQYDFTDGMNLKDQVPFDAEALANTIQTKSIVNDAEGWVQNVPQADIEAQLTQFQNQLKTYIENQNPNSTVSDVLGLQQIKVLPARPLAAGLPYNRIITSQTFNEVPNNLRHKFKYTLATESYGYPGDEFISIEEPTAKLAGKTIALSFKPATKADEDIIASRLPAPEADGSTDPAKLSKTLPGYLINLTAEFTINGETIKFGAAGKMGGELYEEMGLWSPKEGWETSINHPTAGSYRAIGLNLQGINPEQAARLRQQLEVTKLKLDSADSVQLGLLTKHNLVGDLLYGTVLNYFVLNDLQDQIAAQSSNIISYRLPSYGTFSTNMQTQYWFGLPRNVSFSGLSMDIDHMKQHRISKTNDKNESIAFSQNAGSRMSAMEHHVPEQMFSSTTEKAQGISAVKALTIASQQGQKIWTINNANLNLALSRINLGVEAENDIRNAVNEGKIATTHENRINFNGWIGEGYTLIDPNTGAGAYMISGGGNGSETIESDISKRLGWSQYQNVGSSVAVNMVMVGMSVTLSLISNVIQCYQEEIKEIALFALVVIAAVALGVLLTGGAGAVAIPMVLRYLIAAILGSASASASAASRSKWVCDLKCQVYKTTDPLKGIIGLSYGSACGSDKHQTYLNAKNKAGQYVNDVYGPGHGYRHCTPEPFACKPN